MKTNARRWIARSVKILVGIVAAAVLAATVGLFWLVATMNTQAGRQRVEFIVSQALDRKVRIGGPIGLNVSLWPRIVVEDLSISNPDWASTPLFVTVERVEARLGVLPFLLRRLDLTSLRATGVRLWLEQRADGTPNWRFGRWLKRKSVRSLRVQQAQISFRPTEGPEFRANFSLLEASLALRRPVRLHVRGDYRGLPVSVTLRGGALNALLLPNVPWSVNGRLELGDSRMDLQGRVMEPAVGTDAELLVEVAGAGLRPFETVLQRPLPAVAQYRAHARMQASGGVYSVTVAALADDLTALLPHRHNAARRRVTVERIEGRFEAEGKEVTDIIRQARWSLSAANGAVRGEERDGEPPALAVKGVRVESVAGDPIRLTADAVFNTIPFAFRAETGPMAELLWPREPIALHASLSARGLESDFQGVLRPPFTDGLFEGDLAVLADDLAVFGPLMARQWPALGPLRLSARLARLERNFQATDMAVDLGRSSLKGELDLTPGDQPKIRIILSRGVIDIADFAQGSAPVEKPDARAQARRLIPDATLPTELLHRLDAELLLRKLRFVRQGDPIDEVEGQLHLSAGRLSVGLSGGKAFSSTVEGRFVLDAATEPPVLELSLSVKALDYGVLLRRSGLSDKVRGTLDLDAGVAGRGKTVQGALAEAQGGMTFSGGEGLIPRRLLELWGGGVFTALLGVFGGHNQTDLNCLAGRFSIDEGVLESDTLLVDTADITIAGDVTVDLENEELKGVFRARSKRGALVKVGRPVELSGTLAQPQARLAGSRIVELGKWIIGLSDPRALILLFGELGAGEKNPCRALLERREEGSAAP